MGSLREEKKVYRTRSIDSIPDPCSEGWQMLGKWTCRVGPAAARSIRPRLRRISSSSFSVCRRLPLPCTSVGIDSRLTAPHQIFLSSLSSHIYPSSLLFSLFCAGHRRKRSIRFCARGTHRDWGHLADSIERKEEEEGEEKRDPFLNNIHSIYSFESFN